MLKKKINKQKRLPDYRFLGCPLTKNRTPWCFRICTPDENNMGKCGRVAPHSLKGKIQNSIINYELRSKRL